MSLVQRFLNGRRVSNANIFIDHPTRTGDPTARGVPAIDGVSLFNGNYHHSVTDMLVPGKGIPFELKRSYNSYYWSKEKARGAVDNYKPWRFNWDLRAGAVAGATGQVYVQLPDGSSRSFYLDGSAWRPIDQGSFDAIDVVVSSGIWQITYRPRNGLIYRFAPGAEGQSTLLSSVCDHSDLTPNCLTVTPNASGKVGSVTDTMGRVFNFTYHDGSNPTCSAAGPLKAVTTVDGQSLHGPGWGVSYCWTVDNPPNDPNASPKLRERIRSVTDLRGQIWRYEYKDEVDTVGPRTFLWKIKDPNGKTQRQIQHTAQAFGNFGVSQLTVPDKLSDASVSTMRWQFTYAAKKANGSVAVDIGQAASFETTATPPTDICNGQACVQTAHFDAAGRALSLTNAKGDVTQFTPRDKSQLTAANYNLSAQINESRSPLGFNGNYGTQYQYSAVQPGWTSAVITPRDAGATNTTQRGYFNNSTLISGKNLLLIGSNTSPSGLQSSFYYDTSGRLTQRTAPNSGSTNFGPFTAAGQPQIITDPRGTTTALGYLATALTPYAGYLTSRSTTASAALVSRETMEYDRLGRVIVRNVKVDGVRTATWRYEYFADGKIKRIYDPLHTTADARYVEYDYHPSGTLKSKRDGRNQQTDYEYDAANRLTRTVLNNFVSPVDGTTRTVSTRQEYDSLGRVVKQWSGNNNLVGTTVYDPATGQAIRRGNGLYPSNPTTLGYDADGRLERIVDPDGRETRRSYYRDGLLQSEISLGLIDGVQRFIQTQYFYDSDGRLVRKLDPRGNNTCYEYFPPGSGANTGQLKKVRNAATSTTCPDAETTAATEVVSYDLNGNPTRIKDPRGGTIDIEYDGLNRETKRTYYADLAATQSQYWTTKYDLAGNVVERTAPGTPQRLTTTYQYDVLGQLTSMTVPGIANPITFGYDKNGNRTSMTDATGTTTYKYDAANRLWEQTDPWNKTVRFDYDAANNRTRIRYPNGEWVTYGYDALERLKTVTPWVGGTTTYGLDASGRVSGITEFGNGTLMWPEYDKSGRLIRLSNISPSPSVPNAFISSHELGLDANGNWNSAAIVQPLEPRVTSNSRYDMEYDFANKLTSVRVNLGTLQPVSHDPAGRITSLLGSGYAYDGRDLLTNISGTNASTYTYNGAGQRVASFTPSLGARRFVIDPNPADPTMHQVLTDTDTSGNPQRHYIYGYGLVAQIDQGNSVKHYHFDPTGNTLALTNEQGEITDAYAYLPYGETTALGTTVNPYRFNGKYGVADDGNGHLYMRARMYRPDVSRFLSLDALPGEVASTQSLNRYAFARGNPITKVDATGFAPSSFTGSLAAGGGIDFNAVRYAYGGEPSRSACPWTKWQMGSNVEFARYEGDSGVFHGGFEGYVGITRASDGLYPECFYDEKGKLVTSRSEDAWCQGSANIVRYTGPETKWDHIRYDVLTFDGAKGLACSMQRGTLVPAVVNAANDEYRQTLPRYYDYMHNFGGAIYEFFHSAPESLQKKGCTSTFFYGESCINWIATGVRG